MIRAGAEVLEIRRAPRAGRAFAPIRERELDDVLRRLAVRLPGAKQGLILSPEFPGPRGVVDLLAVTRVRDALEERSALGAPFLKSETDCAVVAATHERAVRTSAHIAKALAMSERQVNRRLRELEAHGFVVRAGAGYLRREGLRPLGRAYALEAKVTDWRRGLEQALRYSSWCDAAGVVLLTAPNDTAAVLGRFRALGIGLAVKESWLVRPRLGRANPARRLVLSELLASAMELRSTETN